MSRERLEQIATYFYKIYTYSFRRGWKVPHASSNSLLAQDEPENIIMITTQKNCIYGKSWGLTFPPRHFREEKTWGLEKR